MNSSSEFANVRFLNVVKSLQDATLAYEKLWTWIIGTAPCIPCLCLHLHNNAVGRVAPNLISLLHDPFGIQHLQRYEEIKKEIDVVINKPLKENPNFFKCTHLKDGQNLSKNTRGCNWRKSGCVKKYCECYQANIPCGTFWKWVECKNCTKSAPVKKTKSLVEEQEMPTPSVSSKLIDNLSKSLMKGLQNTNSSEMLNLLFKNSNSLNMTWELLNKRQEVSLVPPLPSFGREQSSLSEVSFGSTTNHSIKQTFNKEELTLSSFWAESSTCKAPSKTEFIHRPKALRNHQIMPIDKLSETHLSKLKEFSKNLIGAISTSEATKTGKINYAEILNSLSSKRDKKGFNRLFSTSSTQGSPIGSLNQLQTPQNSTFQRPELISQRLLTNLGNFA